MIRVAVDAMGGDYAPAEIVKGAVDAVNEREDISVFLCGVKEQVEAELAKNPYPKDRVTVVPASEVIEMAEPPVNAIRNKRDSSMVVGMNLVKDGRADAFCSSGSTGALLVGAQLIVGRIPGVRRPPLATVMPTTNGISLLIDCGANVDARADHLVQFARMGTVYMRDVMGVADPTVAIVNIGAEEEKGNALVKETMPLLKECPDIHFTGSIEARDIPYGKADVIVCEAFVGNVILKLYEGTANALIGEIKSALTKSLRGKIGGWLVRPSLRELLKRMDASEYGGAPLLGLNNLVVKSHGSSKAKEIRNTIFQCATFKEQKIDEKIRKMMDPAGEA